MTAWTFFIENETAIKRMCSILARGDGWLADDLYTEAALRMPRVYEMHAPNRLKILRIVRWYLWKYRNKYRKRMSITFEGDIEDNETPNKVDLDDEVYIMLEGLEEWQKTLLLWKAEGFTLKEIADCVGVSPCTVRNYLIAATEQCQEAATVRRIKGTTHDDAKHD